MFIGEYHHTQDDKGRVQMPAKWRSQLAGGAVVTKGFDGSLTVYPSAVWAVKAEKLSALPQSQAGARAFVRQTLAGAFDVEIDKMGRWVIPGYLREFAGLSKNVVLAGLYDHIEIWSQSAWQHYQSSVDSNSPEYTATLKELGI
jgi:MraZ protein